MRVIAALLASMPILASAADGEYCVMPRLQAGVPATVEVEYIDKPFCGIAMIENRYVRLDEVAKSKEIGNVRCSSAESCTRTNRYYTDEKPASAPYIIIFHGPKNRRDA